MSARRLSQAISEGDGISVLVEVRDAHAAGVATADRADGLVLRGLVDGLGAVTQLPVLVYGPSLRDAADATADAVVVGTDTAIADVAGAVDQAIALGLECVVRVADEDALEAVLDQLDPELLLLCADDVEDDETPLERLLALLHDVPAGKLVVAELAVASRTDVEELERAGVDAVIVASGAGSLIGESPPDV